MIKMANSLVAFYSRAGENYVSGTIKELSVGNTETAAEIIAELTGADMFKIEQENPYSENYNKCTDEALDDQRRNARPKLVQLPGSVSRYDVIYLGYPNYWNTVPMAVMTFLEGTDFDGKLIKPFCTHEGSSLGSSVRDIKKACPNAIVAEGLAICGGNVLGAKDIIERWV